MALAVALVVLIVGSVLFHFVSPWWFTPVASNWGTIDDTITITFWVTGAVFVGINLFIAYCVIRFRHKKGAKADYQPENKKLEVWLTGLTAVGVAALLAPGLFVWAKIVNVPDDASEFEVVAQQWNWSYRFPGKDNALGTSHSRFVSDDNPLGIDPEDPNGQDDVLVLDNELHLPLGKPVKALLRSKDVLHNFSVAQFRIKMDFVPGLVSFFWFTPTKVGSYDLLCEELCGLAHFAMRGRVVIDEPSDFDAWLGSHPTFADTQNQPPVDLADGARLYAVCGNCHGADGQGIKTLNAPKLSGQEAWYMKRQLAHFKNGARGYHEGDLPGQQMAAMATTLPDQNSINNVVAYIKTLPDVASEKTVAGDVDNGRSIYRNCAACHGADAQGVQATNATRLSNMSDWYLVTQLNNFKNGMRGKGPHDSYGPQMALMASVLTTDQAVNDIVAYINSLH